MENPITGCQSGFRTNWCQILQSFSSYFLAVTLSAYTPWRQQYSFDKLLCCIHTGKYDEAQNIKQVLNTCTFFVCITTTYGWLAGMIMPKVTTWQLPVARKKWGCWQLVGKIVCKEDTVRCCTEKLVQLLSLLVIAAVVMEDADKHLPSGHYAVVKPWRVSYKSNLCRRQLLLNICT